MPPLPGIARHIPADGNGYRREDDGGNPEAQRQKDKRFGMGQPQTGADKAGAGQRNESHRQPAVIR